MNEIDKIVDQLEEFIETGKSSTFSPNKVTFNKKELLIYVDNLKLLIPEKVRMAQRIVENEESILRKAAEKAAEIIENANAEADKLIDESTLIERAYEKADEIIQQAEMEKEKIIFSANSDASVIRRGALSYTADMLAEIEKISAYSLSTIDKSFQAVMEAMKSNAEDLSHNKKLIERELGELKEGENAYPEEEDEDFHVQVSPEDFYDEDDSTSEEE